MMNRCSVTFAVVIAECVAVWAAADAAVLAGVLILSVVAAAVLAADTVWNAVVEFRAAASTASVAVAGCFAVECVAVAACFAVERVRGSAAEQVHAAE